MRADKIEDIITFLKENGVEINYDDGKAGEFNRIIELNIEGTLYYIEWWHNQSYLKFRNEFSVPSVPFKYININPYSPTSIHRLHLCFYDVKEPKNRDFMYNEIPFGALRIPFNNIK